MARSTSDPQECVVCGPGTRVEAASINFNTEKARNFTGTLDR
jgi:hypothetical protein